MSEVLAIGEYQPWDETAFAEEFGAALLQDLAALTSMPVSERNRVRVVAHKGHARFDGATMDLLPQLGLIANFGVGYDAIDVAAAQERNIAVTNTPDVLTDDVADLAAVMLVAQARQLVQGSDWVRSGNWGAQGPMPLNRTVRGRKVGIVGLGRIGHAIAQRLAAFGMEIHYHSRSEKETPGWRYHADPVALAEASDDLVVALVGGPETEGYVSAEVLKALGSDGLIVNISRGSTIDEYALLGALEKGTIRGAALDVFRNEPGIDPRFLALDNVLLQPHQGSATIETRQAMGRLQRENVAAFLAGEALKTRVA
ncbi:Lactate dehydrogenase [Tranquillimonas rosea]|uniref:Lactate dehydrogenase n=1 Tax=Tranquillimonas rosea TaxID=641238 RepID=A0A1H9UD31_9RHOB|nr:2-hydroxyacid dehydrogenase [Tranquillimonas rosea]SES07252.1 Lactate dehydrogenase [Tranquillimonas rosea]